MNSFMESIQTDLIWKLNKQKDDIFISALQEKGIGLEMLVHTYNCKRVIIPEWELYYYGETFIVAFKRVELKFVSGENYSEKVTATIQYQTTLPLIDKQ